MSLHECIQGGGYLFDQEGKFPVFVFKARDLQAARVHLQDMVVDLDVRFDQKGQLAYHLEVPDRGSEAVAIPIAPHDVGAMDAGARVLNTCVTVITDDGGGKVDLQPFAVDVTHDFSSAYAGAHRLFMQEKPREALSLVSPLTAVNHGRLPAAHRLEGRCHRALGDLASAIGCYERATVAALKSFDQAFLPSAAGALSDMGVAMKKLGQEGRATVALLHSLALRPNHANALATLLTMFPTNQALARHVFARLSALGNQSGLLQQLVGALAPHLGASPEALWSEAQVTGRALDLSRWPFSRPELGRLDTLVQGLAQAREAQLPPMAP